MGHDTERQQITRFLWIHNHDTAGDYDFMKASGVKLISMGFMVDLCKQEIRSLVYILYLSICMVWLVWIAMLAKVKLHIYHVICVLQKPIETHLM